MHVTGHVTIDWATFPTPLADLREWATRVALWVRQQQAVSNTVHAPQYSVSNLPKAAVAGVLIFVPDESGGAVLAFSDDSGDWRRVTDRAVVS